jgi:hypothetical protein
MGLQCAGQTLPILKREQLGSRRKECESSPTVNKDSCCSPLYIFRSLSHTVQQIQSCYSVILLGKILLNNTKKNQVQTGIVSRKIETITLMFANCFTDVNFFIYVR